ncbi:MAG: hypothetical protein DRI46_10035 [Chloroflexi bacterium]|nr:MAG: hypothetical protein DRI46_10035 [Chloroflexota bacterium]
MDNDDLVFSIYIMDGPKGMPIPVVKQHKDSNLYELELITDLLNKSLVQSKISYVIKMPEPPATPPAPVPAPVEVEDA